MTFKHQHKYLGVKHNKFHYMVIKGEKSSFWRSVPYPGGGRLHKNVQIALARDFDSISKIESA